MYIALLVKGLIIGFVIAAPVGPVNVLCIQRTLTKGRLSGIISGLGAATADTIFGCIAAFGLTLIADFLIDNQFWLRLGGGAFLLVMGARVLLSRPPEVGESAEVTPDSLAGDYASTFLLTLTNPITIISFAAIFAAVGATASAQNLAATWVLILGVFVGSAVWWAALIQGTGAFRHRVNLARLRWIGRFSGIVIVAFGVAAVWSVSPLAGIFDS